MRHDIESNRVDIIIMISKLFSLLPNSIQTYIQHVLVIRKKNCLNNQGDFIPTKKI